MQDLEERAIRFLADIRFHRSLWLQPDPDRGRSRALRVTYSDIGDPNGFAVLLCGGLFSSRYTLAQADDLAKERKIRLITPDKPGIGGSEPVELGHKAEVWLDIVQALVKHLGLGHISMIGHSSGAIYVLNAVLALRHLLHPTRPYAALLAPWVHSSHSKLLASSLANMFPNWAVRRWYDISYLTTRTVKPILGPSTARPGVEMKGNDEHTRAIDEKVLTYALQENIEGVSQEALFCIKRGPDNVWGPWKDYDEYIPLLKESEVRRSDGVTPQLTLHALFAERDESSGKIGNKWFDNCWKRSQEEEGWINYQSRFTQGTTHETIMRADHGVIEEIFSEISKSVDSSPRQIRVGGS